MKNQTERRASERNYYVDGNTVRRMEAVPDYRRERREREERESTVGIGPDLIKNV